MGIVGLHPDGIQKATCRPPWPPLGPSTSPIQTTPAGEAQDGAQPAGLRWTPSQDEEVSVAAQQTLA